MTRLNHRRALAAVLGCTVGFAALGGGGTSALGQTSELYLTDWNTPATYVVQNGAIVRQFNRSSTSDGPGLVVQSTIKCIGQDRGATGREYDLNGGPLSGSYLNRATPASTTARPTARTTGAWPTTTSIPTSPS